MTYTHHTYALVYIYIYTTTNLMLQNDQKNCGSRNLELEINKNLYVL